VGKSGAIAGWLEGIDARRLYWALAMVGASALAIVIATMNLGSIAISTWVVLAAFALLAELWPVEINRRGLRVTFTLAYVAAIAFAVSPWAAILTDALIIASVSLAHAWRRKSPQGWRWAILNCSISVIATAGAWWLPAVFAALSPEALQYTLGTAAYMALYVAINLSLVAWVEWTARRRSFRENVLSSLGVRLWLAVAYVLVAVAVTALASEGHLWAIALTFLPIFALRKAFEYQAQAYEQYFETVETLSSMLDQAHSFTQGHLRRIGPTAESMAMELGMPPERARQVREAAVLHDLGKIAVDEKILDKPSRLTEEEMELVRMHPIYGARILAPATVFAPLVPWILHHHERIDGTGYPVGLAGNQIPLESRILSVVDAYDAMTGMGEEGQHRPYRDLMSHIDAMQELRRCSGTQFDPKVVDALEAVLNRRAA
jgi:hypothetical protein